MTETMQLSKADVERLMRDPSPDSRADAATKVAHAFSDAHLTDAERQLARDIIAAFAHDAVVRVRQALSENLKDSPDIPHDLALKLAKDVAEVAAPMLASSTVLSEADLIEIVSAGSSAHQTAIASRRDVPVELAGVLVEKGSEDAVSTLMKNDGAQVDEAHMEKALTRFEGSQKVADNLALRAKLPITITERLVAVVSDKIREHLVTHHEMPADLAADLLLQSREKALVGLMAENESVDLAALVRDLKTNGRLTPTLILRALCTGDIDFFEHAMAVLAGIPVQNAHRLINDPGRIGLKTLYDRCSLPPELFDMVRIAIDVVRETQYNGLPGDRQRFVESVIERTLTAFDTIMEGEDIDWLIRKLSGSASARSQAA